LLFFSVWNNAVLYLQDLSRHRPKQYSRFTAVLTDLSQSIRLVFSYTAYYVFSYYIGLYTSFGTFIANNFIVSYITCSYH